MEWPWSSDKKEDGGENPKKVAERERLAATAEQTSKDVDRAMNDVIREHRAATGKEVAPAPTGTIPTGTPLPVQHSHVTTSVPSTHTGCNGSSSMSQPSIEAERMRTVKLIQDYFQPFCEELKKVNGCYDKLAIYVENLWNDVATLKDKVQQFETGTVVALAETQKKLCEAEDTIKKLEIESEKANKYFRGEASKYQDIKEENERFEKVLGERDKEIEKLTIQHEEDGKKKEDKDKEISGLTELIEQSEREKKEEIERLKAEHEKAIVELEQKHGAEIDAVKAEGLARVQKIENSVREFVPEDVCELFDYHLGEDGDDAKAKWQIIYAFLSFIKGNLRSDVFVARFRVFDNALYEAMKDDPEGLTNCREQIQSYLAREYKGKIGGVCVEWPKIGDVLNPDFYNATSESGVKINAVVNAFVYKEDGEGKRTCLSRGKVETE